MFICGPVRSVDGNVDGHQFALQNHHKSTGEEQPWICYVFSAVDLLSLGPERPKRSVVSRLVSERASKRGIDPVRCEDAFADQKGPTTQMRSSNPSDSTWISFTGSAPVNDSFEGRRDCGVKPL